MNRTLYRIAAVIAVTIGSMAIISGGQVLLGKDPGYFVIDWLPVYNFTIGVLSVFVTAILIWRQSPYALPAAVATFSAHATVMLLLQTYFSQTVAMDSIVAMAVRLVAWLSILALMFLGSRRRTATAS